MRKHLCFGLVKDFREKAHREGWSLDDYKVCKKESDFYGYNNVELHYSGDAHTYDAYELYGKALRYFEAKGIQFN